MRVINIGHTLQYSLGKVTNTILKFNEELWRITKQKPMEIRIKRRKWNQIGYTSRKEAVAIEETALDWHLQG
jgi:2C-methyl-D-erythritol 2,4-cyclodiphosphate synthase